MLASSTAVPAGASADALPADVRRAWLTTFVTLAALTAVRLVVGPLRGFGVDEAHYALYGVHLDWSYFDHPPMVGWLQGFALQFGDGLLALRAVPIALAFVTGCLVHALTRALFPSAAPRTATWAVLLVQLSPMAHLIALGALPESPLIVAGLVVALLCLRLARVVPGDRVGLGVWLLLGVALGLAGLSKYTAVMLLVTVALSPRLACWRTWVASPGPWLTALVGLVVTLPVWVWNLERGGMSLLYQMGHGVGDDGWSLEPLGVSLVGQLAAWSPALVVGGLGALWAHRRDAAPAWRVGRALVVPLLGVFAVASLRDEVLPHWTALGWIAAAPFAARGLVESPRPRLVGTSVVLGVVFFAVIHGALWRPVGPLRALVAPLEGWDEAAEIAVGHRAALASEGLDDPQLFVENWTHASRLAWAARPSPVVVLDRREDQFDLWFGAPRAGSAGVLVEWLDDLDELEERPSDLKRFDHAELLDEFPVEVAGAHVASFRFWRCEGHR